MGLYKLALYKLAAPADEDAVTRSIVVPKPGAVSSEDYRDQFRRKQREAGWNKRQQQRVRDYKALQAEHEQNGSAGIGTVGDLSNPVSRYSYIRRKPIPGDLRNSVITPRDALFQARRQNVNGTYTKLDPSAEVSNSALLKARESQASSHANTWASQGMAFNKVVERAMRGAGEHWQRLMQRGEWNPDADAPMPNELLNHPMYKQLKPKEKELMQHQLNNMVYNNNANTGYRHA